MGPMGFKSPSRSYGGYVRASVGLAKLDQPVTPRPPAPRPYRPANTPRHTAGHHHLAEPPVIKMITRLCVWDL